MQTLRVEDAGLAYIFRCVAEYSGGCWYLALYVLALIYICRKAGREEKQLFTGSAIMLALTVYNPVFPLILARFFDVNKEYYRFLWITPVCIVVPYAMVLWTGCRRNAVEKLITAAGFCLILAGSGVWLYTGGYIPANTYKVDAEVFEVSELIHTSFYLSYHLLSALFPARYSVGVLPCVFLNNDEK